MANRAGSFTPCCITNLRYLYFRRTPFANESSSLTAPLRFFLAVDFALPAALGLDAALGLPATLALEEDLLNVRFSCFLIQHVQRSESKLGTWHSRLLHESGQT